MPQNNQNDTLNDPHQVPYEEYQELQGKYDILEESHKKLEADLNAAAEKNKKNKVRAGAGFLAGSAAGAVIAALLMQDCDRGNYTNSFNDTTNTTNYYCCPDSGVDAGYDADAGVRVADSGDPGLEQKLQRCENSLKQCKKGLETCLKEKSTNKPKACPSAYTPKKECPEIKECPPVQECPAGPYFRRGE